MRIILLLITIFAVISLSFGQNTIEGYEYWFNDDYENKIVTPVAPVQQLNLNLNIPTHDLNRGLNTINFRSYDSAGRFSSTLSRFFYKITEHVPPVNREIIEYEYWFNNDYASAINNDVSGQKQFDLNELIDAQELSTGIHTLNIRFKDNAGLWSSTLSHFFYKIPEHTVAGSREIVAYEYWFNNDYASALTVNTPVQQQVSIDELIDAESLSNGLHTLNIRFKDNSGLWSSIIGQFFYKVPVKPETLDNSIVAYRYWLNDNFDDVVDVTLQMPVKQFSLIENLNLTNLPKGEYTIHFQFKDELGMWSGVTTDEIEKLAQPVADFEYTVTTYCDSTVISFINKSIDADSYLWDFGDGNTSPEENPVHTYVEPDIYNVSLKATEIASGFESTVSIPIEITSQQTSSNISVSICDSYTAPDGLVYTTSGIKTAVISNVVGCDSVITIDLTILESTSNSIAEVVCNSYTAPDGQVHTTSGIKTAVIPNTAGCDSTITIDLTILESTSNSIVEAVCGSYEAPDGTVHSTSGIKTAIIPNAAGCDSIITIDLTILESSSSSITATACGSFTAPDETVYSTSGVITAVIPNTAGCDSVITIDLTIYNVDISITQHEHSLIANATDAAYQWLDCDKDYSPVPGATDQTFEPFISGNYAVAITWHDCVNTSACYAVTPVSFIKSSFGESIAVYPNPTDGKVFVDFGEGYPEMIISINDISGRAIMNKRGTFGQTLEIEIDGPPGIYFMTIISKLNMAVIRLIKY